MFFCETKKKKKVYSLNRFFTNQRKSSDHFSDAALVKYVPIQQGEPQKFCGVFYYTYFMLEGKTIIHYIHMVDVLFGPSVRSPVFKMAVSLYSLHSLRDCFQTSLPVDEVDSPIFGLTAH